MLNLFGKGFYTLFAVFLFMLLVIDNGSPLCVKIVEVLEDFGVSYVVCRHFEDISGINGVTGVILSGGDGSPYGPLNFSAAYSGLFQFAVPVLGICMGHEIVCVAYGGTVGPLPLYQKKIENIKIHEKDPIFDGFDDTFTLFEHHGHHTTKVPVGFRVLASSVVCPVEVMKHEYLPVYSVQGHPEVSGRHGIQFLRNFLCICGHDVSFSL